MKVLYSWLQELIPGLQTAPQEIAERLVTAGIEIAAVDCLPDGDAILDFDLTPNRSDCLSMWGAAFEVAAVLGMEAVIPQLPEISIREDRQLIQLQNEELCPWYLALLLNDVKIGPSPAWLSARLAALGMRGINNIVDITNYVMLETGQPLHAFDYDCLRAHQVVVRTAKSDETIKTLDGQERSLTTDTLLICDSEKAIGIAGVMGGLQSEVTPQTKQILFEAASFERRFIRRAANRLSLRSEAAIRFEKGVDPAGLKKALQRVVQLAKLLQAGTPDPIILSGSSYAPVTQHSILLRRAYLTSRLGMVIEDLRVYDSLRRLGFQVEQLAEGWQVQVPTRRQDIELEVDLVEEVARLVSFDRLPAELPVGMTTQGGLSSSQKNVDLLHLAMVRFGMHEMVNYSFINEQDLIKIYPDEQHPLRNVIRILNPMSEMQGVMRTSLLPGMLQAIAYNLNRQNLNLGLYELGKVYLAKSQPMQELPLEETHLVSALVGTPFGTAWMKQEAEANFYHLKGMLEQLAHTLHVPLLFETVQEPELFHPFRSASVRLHGKIIGSFGVLHPDLLKRFDIQKEVILADLNADALLQFAEPRIVYQSLSRYQAVNRDLALLVPVEVSAADVQKLIEDNGGDILETVALFDVYTGSQVKPGFKSLAFALTYRAKDHSLTEPEVLERHQAILNEAARRFASSLRM